MNGGKWGGGEAGLKYNKNKRKQYKEEKETTIGLQNKNTLKSCIKKEKYKLKKCKNRIKLGLCHRLITSVT